MSARLAADPSLVQKRIRVGWVHSREARDKISKSHAGLRHTAASRLKMSVAKTGRMHTGEWRDAMSEKMKGRVFSEEHRRKLSAAGMGHRAWHARDKQFWHGPIRMRSSFEVRVALALDALGVAWEYEPRRFTFTDRSSYTPDFYLPGDGAYWEVKGWFNESAKRTVSMFRHEYPEVPLVVFGQSCIETLERSAIKA